MNKEEFRQHFIQALTELGIDDYCDRNIIVEPCFEPDKTYNGFDDMMRLCVFPKTRKMPFDQIVDLLTSKEGYFPCWIDIGTKGNGVYLRLSLRMRKASKKDSDGIFPFRIVVDYKDIELPGRLPYIIKHAFYVTQIKGTMFVSEDIYNRIPGTYCIFPETDTDESIQKISRTLESFQGNCKWCLYKSPFSRKNLYVISVEEFRIFEQTSYDYNSTDSVREFYGEPAYKSICEKAIADLEKLCDWFYQEVNR